MKMRTFLQILLVAWFVILSAFLFISSYKALGVQVSQVCAVQCPPEPPVPPDTLDQAHVDSYAQEVMVYKGRIEAYQAYLQVDPSSHAAASYKTVVSDTLAKLLDQTILALLGYAFVVGAATTVNNIYRMGNQLEPQPLRFF